MGQTIHCVTHGESATTFVCNHLVGETVALGFNRNEPTPANRYPDAWCDDCEIIRVAHGGWNEQSEKLLKVTILCSGCYERARIRNTRTSISLDDLAHVRWKCGSCDEWHTGPCLDFSYDSPDYWRSEFDEVGRHAMLLPNWKEGGAKTFLNENYCAIDGDDFFVRGIIYLPIVGTAETFRWGVWGSLSRENFTLLLKMDEDPKRVEVPSMFSWLSTQIPEYPDTLNLRMNAHIQSPDEPTRFELEPAEHPLSREFHEGISPKRVKEIMMGRLRENE